MRFIDEESPDLICVTEHFLKFDEVTNSTLNEFQCVTSFCRSHAKGGGAGIWLKPSVKCEALDCNEFVMEVCELSAVSLKIGDKKIFLMAVNRPPSINTTPFLISSRVLK